MSHSPAELLAVLQANLHRVHERIEQACARVGRSPASVQLVAVTKYAPLPAIAGLIACGQRRLGENRPQQLITRAQQYAPAPITPPLKWDLIGQLQSNKVRAILPWAALIHSVDSPELVQRIARIAKEMQVTPQLLLQVNVSGEGTKGGFEPDQLRAMWDRISDVDRVHIAGLMTMAPFTDETAVIRHAFRGLREIRDELHQRSPHLALNELSMGMSHDFEIAIEEGATLIRIGSLLFEGSEST